MHIWKKHVYFLFRHYSCCNIDKPFTILYLQLFVLHIYVFLRSFSFQRNLNHRGCVTSGSNTIIQFIGCATNQPQKLVSISRESFQKRISIHTYIMVIEIFLCRCRTYNDICIRKVLTLFEVQIEILAISFSKSVHFVRKYNKTS